MKHNELSLLLKREPSLRENQLTFAPKVHTTYGGPQVNYVRNGKQRIELHRGCPWQHEYCYEPPIYEDLAIPELTMNNVEILDMNLLARKDILEVLDLLRLWRVDGKVVKYEAVCGFDFRFLTRQIAEALRMARFVKPRLAWDGPITDQYRLKDAFNLLWRVGYKPKQTSCFMIVNWKIPYKECLRKLDILKVWNVKVCDCCWDGGYRHATPIFWTAKELTDFRSRSRKHNLIVNFGLDPEVGDS